MQATILIHLNVYSIPDNIFVSDNDLDLEILLVGIVDDIMNVVLVYLQK